MCSWGRNGDLYPSVARAEIHQCIRCVASSKDLS
ncbi:uncharacterized protein J3R85_006070 [Psidium guajava]|nr:uncharacterized protein J3R85_006070 [Psidium guajava]